MPSAPILNPSNISGPNPSENVTNDRTLQFSGTASNPGFGVFLRLDGEDVASTTADDNGDYSFDPVAAPDGGTHVWTTHDFDPATGQEAGQSPGTYVTDLYETAVTGISVAGDRVDGGGNGDVPANTRLDYTVTFEHPVTSGDEAGIGSAYLQLSNGRTAGFASLSGDGRQATFVYVTQPGDDTGQIQVSGVQFDQVRDHAGNVPSLQAQVGGALRVDTQAPSVSLAADANGQPTVVVAHGTVSGFDASSPNVTVSEYDAGGNLVAQKVVQVDGGGNYAAGFDATGATDYFTASNADGAGNSGASGTVAYAVQAPAVSVSAANAGATASVSGHVSNLDPAAPTVTVTERDAAGNAVSSQQVSANGNGDFTASFGQPAPGDYTFTASNANRFGQSGSATSDDYRVARPGAPTATISAAATNGNPDLVTVSGNVADFDPSTPTVTVTEVGPDGRVVQQQVNADANGNFTTAFAESTPGQYTYVASTSDHYGDTGTSNAAPYAVPNPAAPSPYVTATNGGAGQVLVYGGISGFDPASPSVTVDVYDRTGALVGENTVTADGDGNFTTSFTETAPGTYTFKAANADRYGDVGTSAPASYVVASPAAPAPAITARENGSDPDSVLVAGSVANYDPASPAVTVVETDANGKAVSSQVVQADANGNFQATFSESTPGTYSYVATSTDRYGDAGTSPVATYTVPVAQAGPVTINSVTAGAVPGQVVVSGRATDLAPASNVVTVDEYDPTGALVGQTSVETNPDGTFTGTFDGTSPGSYTYKATGTTASGSASTSAPSAFTLVPVAPSTPALSASTDTGSSHSDGLTSSPTLTFTGTAQPNSTVAIVGGAAGGPQSTVGTSAVGADGAYTVSGIPAGAADGAYSYHAHDDQGGDSAAANVMVDRTPPRLTGLTFSGPGVDAQGNGTLKPGDTVTATATYDGPVNVVPGAEPSLALDDGGTAKYAGMPTASSVQFTYTVAQGESTADLAATAVNGTVEDPAGNAAAPDAAPPSPAGTLKVDGDAPVVALTGSHSTDARGETTLSLAGKASGIDGATTYAVFRRDGSVSTQVAQGDLGADGTFSFSTPTQVGDNDYYAVVTDKAGAAAISADVDYEAAAASVAGLALSRDPAVDTGTSASDGVTAARTLSFDGMATPDSVVLLTVAPVDADGTRGTPVAVGTTLADASGNYAFASVPAPDPDGRYVYQVSDSHDGTTFGPAGDIPVTIDRTAPSVSETVSGQSPAGTAKAGTTLAFDLHSAEGLQFQPGPSGQGPDLLLSNGARATLDPGSAAGGTDLVFDYTVAPGDDASSLTVAKGGYEANGSVVTDLAGNALDTSKVGGDGQRQVRVDTMAPLVALSGTPATDPVTGVTTLTLDGAALGLDPVADAGSTFAIHSRGGEPGAPPLATGTVGADGSFTAKVPTVDGANDLYATVTDAAGNVGASNDVEYSATAAISSFGLSHSPSVDTGTSQSDGVTSATELSFSGTAAAGSLVTLLVEGADADLSAVATTTAGDDGSFSFSGVKAPSADGQYQYSVDDTHDGGNFGPAYPTTVTIDRTAPLATGVTVSGAGVGKDGSGDVGAGTALTFDVSTDGPVQVTLGPSGLPTLTLSNGARATLDPSSAGPGADDLRFDYTVKAGDDTASLVPVSVDLGGATATDAAGNALDASKLRPTQAGTLKVDTGAPSATLSLGLPGPFEDTSDVTLSGKVTGLDPSNRQVTVLDTVTEQTYQATADASGAYSVSAKLADGHHDFVASASDAVGNVGRSADVSYDVKAPVASAPALTAGTDTGASPADGVTTGANGLEFTGSGLPANSPVSIYETGYGPLGGVPSAVAPVLIGSGVTTAAGTYDVKADGKLPDGIYQVAALGGTYPDLTAYGNGAYSPTSTVVIDTSAPMVTLDQAGGTVASDAVTLTGHVASTSPLAGDFGPTVTVTETVGGQVSVLGSAAVAADGSYSVPVTLSRGAGTVTVADTTAAGVTGTASAAFDYAPAVQGPGVTAAVPTGSIDQFVTMHGPLRGTMSGQVDDPASVASVEVYSGDRDLGAAKVGADGAFHLVMKGPAGTEQDIHAVVTGKDGAVADIDGGYRFTTGVKGQDYTGYTDVYDKGTGAFTGQYYYKADGDLLYKSAYESLANGDQAYHYSQGDFFKDKSYSAFTDTYSADGTLIRHTETPKPGYRDGGSDGQGTGTQAGGAAASGGLPAARKDEFDGGTPLAALVTGAAASTGDASAAFSAARSMMTGSGDLSGAADTATAVQVHDDHPVTLAGAYAEAAHATSRHA